jgi:hypothetical protein
MCLPRMRATRIHKYRRVCGAWRVQYYVMFACDEIMQTGDAIWESILPVYGYGYSGTNIMLFYLGLICVAAGTVLGVMYGVLVRVWVIPTVDDHAQPLLSSTAAASTAGPAEEVVPLFYFAVPFVCVTAGTFVAFVLTWTGVCPALAGAGVLTRVLP